MLSLSEAGLLGAGSGDGSCAASPFRTSEAELAWPEGCPAWASCCTEYGYCHPLVSDIMIDRGLEVSDFRKVGRLRCSVTVTERVMA